MAKYYLDYEFCGFNNIPLSMALVRDDGSSLYLIYKYDKKLTIDPWVVKNVLPNINAAPIKPFYVNNTPGDTALFIQSFLQKDKDPHIIADWPIDIKYFCDDIITGPGKMIAVPKFTFEIARVDSYPTVIKSLIQHNAWYDAVALRYKLTGALGTHENKR